MSSAANAYGDGKAAKRIVKRVVGKSAAGTELSGCIAVISFREEA